MHDYWERKLNEETIALKQLRDIRDQHRNSDNVSQHDIDSVNNQIAYHANEKVVAKRALEQFR